MIKSLRPFLFAILFLALQNVNAQNWCNSTRYDQEVFSTVQITSDVTYGANIDNGGNNLVLTMDIYEPSGDTASIRPLIVWAHGGSFLGGTKNDADVTSLCNHFAKRGYVCVSINYRLGITLPPSQTTATQAVYRAVQDMKAAIRYFRQDATTTNTYKIDPSTIFAAGSSAGAFTALHLAYLNEPSELPAVIDTTIMGGMEGTSGNPGYASTVNAVVNLCGALGDKTWVIPGDVPLCSMHGTNDQIVPYATATLYLLNIFPIMQVDGSYSINDYATGIGVPNVMFTYYGQDHVPYASSLAYMDTTVRFVSNFLYSYLGCTPSDPNPLPNTFGPLSANTITSSQAIQIYPQPATNEISITANGETIQSIQLFDVVGKLLLEKNINASEEKIDISSFKKGCYFVSVLTENGRLSTKLIKD
ncbi:MAG: T9SS type A sorting domain-containing protein [Bacteroidetes bacterium]|nr:T9SS type A sorting domain-containing protein [Bacteroidota bacterium]